jgi:hypothetical protein
MTDPNELRRVTYEARRGVMYLLFAFEDRCNYSHDMFFDRPIRAYPRLSLATTTTATTTATAAAISLDRKCAPDDARSKNRVRMLYDQSEGEGATSLPGYLGYQSDAKMTTPAATLALSRKEEKYWEDKWGDIDGDLGEGDDVHMDVVCTGDDGKINVTSCTGKADQNVDKMQNAVVPSADTTRDDYKKLFGDSPFTLDFNSMRVTSASSLAAMALSKPRVLPGVGASSSWSPRSPRSPRGGGVITPTSTSTSTVIWERLRAADKNIRRQVVQFL